jgi:hypothetical protein
MLLLNTPTASISLQVTTLPRISVRTALGRSFAYSIHIEPKAPLILSDKLAGNLFRPVPVIVDPRFPA